MRKRSMRALPPEPGVSIRYDSQEHYKSQEGQDKWVNEHIFRSQIGGIFVDLGCYDGVTYSNTWYFERLLNWTGVCVEPNPDVYPRIASQAGRSSGVQLAVSDHENFLDWFSACAVMRSRKRSSQSALSNLSRISSTSNGSKSASRHPNTSGTLDALDATTTAPHDMASNTGKPKPSCQDGKTKHLQRL